MMRQDASAAIILSISAGIFAATPLLGQNPPPAFDSIRASASYKAAILNTFQKYEGSLSTPCREVTLAVKEPPKVLAPFQLNEKGEILNAQWRESGEGEGAACGHPRRFNAFVMIHDGKPLVLPEFPGDSFAGPTLQRDGLKYAAIAANAGPGCTAEVEDTHLVGTEPAGPKAAWDERWDVRSCGGSYVVTMHFIPDATGTTIRTSLKETVRQ